MDKKFHNKNVMFTIIAFLSSVVVDHAYYNMFLDHKVGVIATFNWNLITTLPVSILVYLFFYIINKKFPSFNLKTKKSKVTYVVILLITFTTHSFYIKPDLLITLQKHVEESVFPGRR